MARPKKDPEQLKNVDLRIPVTASQKKLVMNAAGLDGGEFAAWAREVLLKAADAAGRSKKAAKKKP